MIGPFMMEDMDGTGDGECGNGMQWMGNPVAGLEAAALEDVPAGISEMTGPEAWGAEYPP
jgi:hypothetical protein